MKSNPLRLLMALSLAFLASRAGAATPDAGPQLGLQTWTCRNMTFDQVVDFATSHHLKYLEFIAAHLDPNAPPAENLRKKAVLDRHGLVAYSFGVNPTSLDKESNRRLFEFARLMGIKLIIVEPKDPAQWDNLEELVKEYDIRLAIHNHGKGTVNADPANVKRILAARDPRIGVCLDIGWVTAAGFDAAKVFREYGNRVFDMHFKDKKSQEVDGKTQWNDTLPGEGDANMAGLFAEIRRTGWSGVMAIETDSKAFAADPNELVNRSAEYFQEHVAK